MKRYLLAALLLALLLVVPAEAQPGAGYGPPAPRPWVQMRPGEGGGHILTWYVSDDADAWRVTVDGAEVFTARYIHPGELVDVSLSPEQWIPGKEVRICAFWTLRTGTVQSCHAFPRPFVLWVGVVH
jgi:hypothetical protein